MDRRDTNYNRIDNSRNIEVPIKPELRRNDGMERECENVQGAEQKYHTIELHGKRDPNITLCESGLEIQEQDLRERSLLQDNQTGLKLNYDIEKSKYKQNDSIQETKHLDMSNKNQQTE